MVGGGTGGDGAGKGGGGGTPEFVAEREGQGVKTGGGGGAIRLSREGKSTRVMIPCLKLCKLDYPHPGTN